MSTRTVIVTSLIALTLSGLAAVSQPHVARAQDVQITGPLANAPACKGCRLYRSGRFMLQPFIGFTLQDDFTRTIPLGVQAGLHLSEWLGVHFWGAWGGLNLDTGLTDEISVQGQSTARNRLSLPSAGGFPDQVGKLNFFLGGQLTFIPLRGKLALFQKIFVDADFYTFVGAAAVQVEERADVTNGVCAGDVLAADRIQNCIATQSLTETRFTFAPTFGAGLMLYASEWLGFSVEWRGLPFSWNTSGTDQGSDLDEFPDGLIDANDRIFQFNHMVLLGVAMFLPSSVDVTE